MTQRYEELFDALSKRNEGAFVPFLMLGDPTPADALEIIRTVVEAGADALELGVPFSDPVADGPTIQKSHIRALDGGVTVDDALAQIRTIRAEFPTLPIGMLIYGNVPFTRGLDTFYREFAEAGADSVLLPDVPVREGKPFITAAEAAGIHPIFIAPAQAAEKTLAGVAAHSKGYIYAVSRDGVTGTERESETTGLADVVANVKRFGGCPHPLASVSPPPARRRRHRGRRGGCTLRFRDHQDHRQVCRGAPSRAASGCPHSRRSSTTSSPP